MRTSRRRLLTSGLLLAGGIFTGRTAGASRLASERLQVGVIGVGNRGATNLAEISKHAQVVALCDVDETYLGPAAAQYPDAKKYRDLRELLQQSSLDAVLISTTDHTHAFAALTAMQRGLHVFCEKPLSRSLDELQRMVSMAQDKKVVTQTGMQHHAREGTRVAAAALRSGLLGDIRSIHAWTNRPIWPQGTAVPREQEQPPPTLAWDLWLGPARERPYHSIYHPLRWRGWHAFGSGALGDFGPHLLDAVFWGLQLPSPGKVEARADERHEQTYPASSEITFAFAETQSRPAFTMHWYDGGKVPNASITTVEKPPPSGVMVIGERGRLFIPDYGRAPRLLQFAKQARLPEPLDGPDDIYLDWVEAIRMQQPAALAFSSVKSLMQTCLLGNVALRCVEAITWNDDARTIAPEAAKACLADDYRDGWRLPAN